MPSKGIFLDDDETKEIAGTASAWTKNTTDFLNISLEPNQNLDTFLTGHLYDVKRDLEELKLEELHNNFENGSTIEMKEIETLNKIYQSKDAKSEEIRQTFKKEYAEKIKQIKDIIQKIPSEKDKNIFKDLTNIIEMYEKEQKIQNPKLDAAKFKSDIKRYDKKAKYSNIIKKIELILNKIPIIDKEREDIQEIIKNIEEKIRGFQDIDESFDKKNEYISKPESLLRDKFAYLLSNIYNDVETEISRPIEISTKIIASVGDIECKNDGNFYLSVEVKQANSTNKDTPCQLVAALLSQAFFKLRRGQCFNGKIEVFGIVLEDLLVSFYKADFTKDNLECIRNKKTPTTQSIVYYTSSFSLKDDKQFKIIIETLYRLKNSTRKDCISNYFIKNKIRFDFWDTDKPLDKYLKIIKAVVKNEDLGMLAGAYFLRKYIDDVSKENELRIYIRCERTHVKNIQFDTDYYMSLLTIKTDCEQQKQLLKLESSADPSYFLKVVKPIYLVLDSDGNYVINYESDETENKGIKTYVRFTELSIKVSIY